MAGCDLTIVETKDLLHELLKRYDAAIFTAYRDLNDKHYDVTTTTKGSTIEVVGLSLFTRQHIEDSIWGDEEE